LPAREIVKTLSKNFLKEASKIYLMPYSDDEEHSPSEFYYPDEISDETNDPNGMLEGENGFSREKVFCFFYTKSEQTAIRQSHIINPLLTSFARSVRESIAFVFYRTDLAPSLGLYEKPQAKLSRTDLAVG
jgi:hypothetical protein